MSLDGTAHACLPTHSAFTPAVVLAAAHAPTRAVLVRAARRGLGSALHAPAPGQPAGAVAADVAATLAAVLHVEEQPLLAEAAGCAGAAAALGAATAAARRARSRETRAPRARGASKLQ